jgi:hypothetical protein
MHFRGYWINHEPNRTLSLPIICRCRKCETALPCQKVLHVQSAARDKNDYDDNLQKRASMESSGYQNN